MDQSLQFLIFVLSLISGPHTEKC